MPVTPAFDPATGANGGASGGGGGGDSIVTPPAATSEAVAAGGSLAAKTFGAFTDPDGVIDNFVASVTNATGSAAVSGSGLGPYTFSNTANGDAGTLSLTARDSSNNPLATATHTYSIALPAGAAPQTLVDISGISSYNFLTTGGSSGSGGEGNHILATGPGGANQTWTLSFVGTSGPTVLQIVNGVIKFEGTKDTNRGLLTANMAVGGVQVGRFPLMAFVSQENQSEMLAMSWMIAQNSGLVNGNNEAQVLLGINGGQTPAVENANALLIREQRVGTSFTVVKNYPNQLTDVRTTPTRMACRMLGGSWQPSFDQGTAALPTSLDNLGTYANRQNNDFVNANAPQNRQFLKLNLLHNVDVRAVVYKGIV
jgi:hypothetical protein